MTGSRRRLATAAVVLGVAVVIFATVYAVVAIVSGCASRAGEGYASLTATCLIRVYSSIE